MGAISNGYEWRRVCKAETQKGKPCRQPPLRDADLCFWHSPDHAKEAAEARRLGGLRSRREHTLAGAYEYEGLESVAAIRRLLEIAVLDTVSLDNSVARSRTLGYLAGIAVKLLEVGELEDRVEALEAAVRLRPAVPEPVFDQDAHDRSIAFVEGGQ